MDGKDVVGLAKIPLALMRQGGHPLIPDVFRLLGSCPRDDWPAPPPALSWRASVYLPVSLAIVAVMDFIWPSQRPLVAAEAAEPLAVTLNVLSFAFRHVFLGVQALRVEVPLQLRG
jgi:hypothetical protein